MALTDGLKLPIPELTDSADGPAAVSGLANAVEDWSYDRILPSGVTRWPKHHWGPVTVLPSGTSVKRGDTAWYSTYNVMVMYDGTNWRQAEIQTVAVGGTGVADPTVPGFYLGQLRDHATLGQQRWNGTTWVAVKSTSADWALVPIVGAPYFQHNDLSSGSGLASATAGPPGLQYRREGDRVYLRGVAFTGTSGVAAGVVLTATQLPAEFRPSKAALFYVPCEHPTFEARRIEFGTNGHMYITGAAASGVYFFFDGLSYALS